MAHAINREVAKLARGYNFQWAWASGFACGNALGGNV